MKVSTERIPESQALMTIEVEAERVQVARGKALKKLASQAKIPGFRPGKAPGPMVERYFGEERILDEALDTLVPDVYREAVLADESIVPVGRPKLVVETTDPLVVKATIPLRPTVELGDYRAARVETEPVIVDETKVDEMLLALRRQHATLEPIERAIGWRDVVRIDVHAEVAGETLVDQKDVEVQLVEGRDVLFPGFEAAILGHTKGEHIEFDLTVPETLKDERFAGKHAHFVVSIHETKEEVLPEPDDDFAKLLGGDLESLEQLTERIRERFRNEEQQRIDNKYHDEILKQLTAQAAIDFPPMMLESEVDRLLHEQVGQVTHGGPDMERFLQAIGKTEEQLTEELRPIADTRLRRSLVLSKVADVEAIEVTDDDVEAELEALSAGPRAAELRQLFGSEQGLDTIRRNLLTRRTLARLVEIATRGAAAGAEVKPKTSRRKKKDAAEAVATDIGAQETGE